jgi:hypothetical protein
VVLVSCLPVVTLGFGAALTHLLRVPGVPQQAGETAREEPATDDAPEASAPEPASVPVDAEHAAEIAYRATVAAGNPLSARKLQERFGLTRSQAAKVRQRVTAGQDERQDSEREPVTAAAPQ